MPKLKKFPYSKTIDRKITVAAQEVLKVRITRAVKIERGEVTHVYKLVSSRSNYLAKVFQYPDWPDLKMLEWIDHQLSRRGISHAKILYATRSSKFFPFGFLITEFIEGRDGTDAVNSGEVSLATAYCLLGRQLREIHRIKIQKYGLVNQGRGSVSDFLKWKLKRDVDERLEDLNDAKALPLSLKPKIHSAIIKLLRPYEKRFRPVLNHGDPNRENAVFSPPNHWTLVDWDNAFSSTWLEDYADLTFWADFRHNKDFTKKRLVIFRKNFKLGYGKMDFSDKEILQIERGLHIIKCMRLLTYYYFLKRSRADFQETKRKLISLLR